MSSRDRLRLRAPHLALFFAASGLAAALSGACSGANTNNGVGAAGAGAESSSASSGQGGAGGAGGASSSSSSSSSGAGGAPGCATDADCALDPKGNVCDTSTGACVGCLPQNDKCIQGQYCSPATQQCEVGCTDDSDCDPVNNLICETSTHTCVGCVLDADCPLGSICLADTCVAGCNGNHACQQGFSCCNSTCYDLTADELHCGTCLIACEAWSHAPALCLNGLCQIGSCDAAWADCDGIKETGCEQNVLQDGSCVCTPGQVQSCYAGSPGTENVGPCHAGTRTCNPDGLSWTDCANQVLPISEICKNGVDEDCNGVTDDAPDLDGDGWSICTGDCCDNAGECAVPQYVNPGAYEVLQDGVDNDCNPATSDSVSPPCSVDEKFAGVTAMDVANAMELCQLASPNPPLAQKKWGIISATQLLASGNAPSGSTLAHIKDWQTAILTSYGTGGVVPKMGATFAGLSTGKMRDAGDTGYIPPSPGTSWLTAGVPPAAYLSAHANTLPASQGCSGACPAGEGANDSVNIRITMRAPTNAQSFSYNFRFFSAEYASFTCTQYNDFYLALLQSGAQGIPADKNISFDALGNPVSVNNGFFDVCKPKGCYQCPAGIGALAGTGMEVNDVGGATNWLTTDAPVVPGETIVLSLMIFDVSDNTLDSVVLLDNFTWSATPSAVNTHE